MSDIEWNATLHWVRTWKSFVQIFLWELLEYFFLSARMFWKELTVNLKINHEGLLWEGLQCADIFTGVPDDNQWRNECEMPTLTKRPVTIQDPAYLACTFSMTRAQFVGFWTTIEYLKRCIICHMCRSHVSRMTHLGSPENVMLSSVSRSMVELPLSTDQDTVVAWWEGCVSQIIIALNIDLRFRTCISNV